MGVDLQYVFTAIQIQRCLQDWTTERTCQLVELDVVTQTGPNTDGVTVCDVNFDSIQCPLTLPPCKTKWEKSEQQ